MGYGKLRMMTIEYFDGTVETVKYTMKNYWKAVGNKAVKSYGVK